MNQTFHDEKDYRRICPECHGTGRTEPDDFICPVCGGMRNSPRAHKKALKFYFTNDSSFLCNCLNCAIKNTPKNKPNPPLIPKWRR